MIDFDETNCGDFGIFVPKKNPDPFGILAAGKEFSEALTGLLRDLVATKTEAVKPKPAPALLSMRQAAARLRVDRNTTLKILISTGQLRTVQAGGRARVPAAEVERLAETGFDLTKPAPARRRRAKPTSGKPGDAILALHI